MSKIIRCEKGHYYDADKFVNCPHCGLDLDKRKKVIADSAMSQDLDNMVTVAKNVFVGTGRKRKTPHVEVPKPPRENLASQVTEEMLEVQAMAARKRESVQEDDQKTVRFEIAENGIEPVVGWLVCVSGEQKGQDFRLQSGFNRIGRDRNMEVVIPKDRTISRDTHCSVVYDGKSNETFLVPGNGTLTYYKNEMVQKAVKLHSGDEIALGENKYIYISFCEGERTWQEKER